MKKYTIIAILTMLFFTSCTENQRARNFGGNSTVEIPQGEKVVVATWKQDDLWILTRKTKQGETPETYTFRESSSFGVWEGTVTIKER